MNKVYITHDIDLSIIYLRLKYVDCIYEIKFLLLAESERAVANRNRRVVSSLSSTHNFPYGKKETTLYDGPFRDSATDIWLLYALNSKE